MFRAIGLLLFLIFSKPLSSWAGFLVEGQLNASAISLGSQVNQTTAQQFGKFGGYLAPGKDQTFWFGAGVSYLGQSVYDGSTTESFATAELTLGMRWSLTRQKWFWLGADIAPASEGIYKASASDTEAWKGASFQGMINIFYPTSDELRLGFSLLFYSGAFSTAASSSKAAQTITGVFPNITLGYQW